MKEYLNRLNSKISQYINKKYSVKKFALHLISWNFKYIFPRKHKKSSFKDNVIHIGFIPEHGLGDALYTIKYLFALKKYFGDLISIDVLIFSENLKKTQFLFNQPFIDNVFLERKYKYDCELSAIRFPDVKFIDKTRLKKKEFKLFSDYINHVDQFFYSQNKLYSNEFAGRCYSLLHSRTRENVMDIDNLLDMVNITNFKINPNIQNEAQIMNKFNLVTDEYITFQTGAGDKNFAPTADTRQWQLNDYAILALEIKKYFPKIKIVQIGDDFQPKIKNIDIHLLGKTNFEEFLIILKNAKLHISQEGGASILRHFISLKPSCTLFGPTDINFLNFSENINISSKMDCCCESLVSDWMKKCQRTNSKALCMQKISVEQVFSPIRDFLTNNTSLNDE